MTSELVLQVANTYLVAHTPAEHVNNTLKYIDEKFMAPVHPLSSEQRWRNMLGLYLLLENADPFKVILLTLFQHAFHIANARLEAISKFSAVSAKATLKSSIDNYYYHNMLPPKVVQKLEVNAPEQLTNAMINELGHTYYKQGQAEKKQSWVNSIFHRAYYDQRLAQKLFNFSAAHSKQRWLFLVECYTMLPNNRCELAKTIQSLFSQGFNQEKLSAINDVLSAYTVAEKLTAMIDHYYQQENSFFSSTKKTLTTAKSQVTGSIINYVVGKVI